jgi:hypothetical protein
MLMKQNFNNINLGVDHCQIIHSLKENNRMNILDILILLIDKR